MAKKQTRSVQARAKTKAKPKKLLLKPKAATMSSIPNYGAGVWPSAGFTAPTTPKEMEKMMNKSQSQFDAFSKDQGQMMKQSMEAMARSGKICAERMQEMMNLCMEVAQGASTKQAEAMKTLMTCKTMNEMTEMQSKMAQTSFDDMMQAMTRFTEMGVRLATDAMEPLNEQIGKAMKKATDSIAA